MIRFFLTLITLLYQILSFTSKQQKKKIVGIDFLGNVCFRGGTPKFLQIVISREIFLIKSYGFRYISPLAKLFQMMYLVI